jgi:hypothetical protein
VLADGFMAVWALLAWAFLHRVGRAVFDAPGADASPPAAGAGLLLLREGLRLVKGLGGDELVRLAGLGGRRNGIGGEGKR